MEKNTNKSNLRTKNDPNETINDDDISIDVLNSRPSVTEAKSGTRLVSKNPDNDSPIYKKKNYNKTTE